MSALPSTRLDAPWQRLPWLIPLALLVSVTALDAFQRILGSGALPAPTAPVDLSVVELPPPASPLPKIPPAPLPERPPAAEASPARAAAAPAEAPAPTAAPAPPKALSVAPEPSRPLPAASAVPSRQAKLLPKIREIGRNAPGMLTQPLSRRPPLTKEEWRHLDKIYHVGRDESTNPTEAMEGPQRAARSAHLPPLTKEQWAALDRIYHVGAGIGVNNPEVMQGPLRAARSPRLPPLTKEQWAALDSIYHVGLKDPTDATVLEADRRGALSIKTAITTPMAAIDYSRSPTFVSHSDMAARAIVQPLPEIPAALAHGLQAIDVVARFAVAEDGSTTVELTQKSAEPKLDALLLAALEKWRFTPAFRDGQAVASTIELRLTITIP